MQQMLSGSRVCLCVRVCRRGHQVRCTRCTAVTRFFDAAPWHRYAHGRRRAVVSCMRHVGAAPPEVARAPLRRPLPLCPTPHPSPLTPTTTLPCTPTPAPTPTHAPAPTPGGSSLPPRRPTGTTCSAGPGATRCGRWRGACGAGPRPRPATARARAGPCPSRRRWATRSCASGCWAWPVRSPRTCRCVRACMWLWLLLRQSKGNATSSSLCGDRRGQTALGMTASKQAAVTSVMYAPIVEWGGGTLSLHCYMSLDACAIAVNNRSAVNAPVRHTLCRGWSCGR